MHVLNDGLVAILGAFLLCYYLESHATVFKAINLYSLCAKFNHDLFFFLYALVTFSNSLHSPGVLY